MGEYKKITKNDINFPEYCLFFIKRLLYNIKEANMDYETTMQLIITTDESYPYCYEAFELIVKTLERKGYTTRIPSFKRIKTDGFPDKFEYKWSLKKKKVNFDDLPF